EVEVRSGAPSVVSVLSDRFLQGARGYAGGEEGARAGFSAGGRPRNPKLSLSLPAGARFILQLPGGGGFGDPRQRDPELVAEDLREGLISRRAASTVYGWPPPAERRTRGGPAGRGRRHGR
ncbi:MAG: hydantoinase B/oxoprolinase family protein, partial [Candidatus Dormibacteraeota bacterium]|nr:hydantoinase B/oxoprolinase family protein [Candidatus Dormibacteraeota bacterium]